MTEKTAYIDLIVAGNGNGHQDQSTTLSTTGINIQGNNLGDISSNNCSPIKTNEQLNFWHSANPALNLMTNHASPKKIGSVNQLKPPHCSSPMNFGKESEQFFVKRTSSRMGPKTNLLKVTTQEENSSKQQDNILNPGMLV